MYSITFQATCIYESGLLTAYDQLTRCSHFFPFEPSAVEMFDQALCVFSRFHLAKNAKQHQCPMRRSPGHKALREVSVRPGSPSIAKSPNGASPAAVLSVLPSGLRTVFYTGAHPRSSARPDTKF